MKQRFYALSPGIFCFLRIFSGLLPGCICPVLVANTLNWSGLSLSTPWLRLLHYTKSSRGFVSRMDGPGFFLAPDGKTNPLEELSALHEAIIRGDVSGKKPVWCRFPARTKLLISADPSLSDRVTFESCKDYLLYSKKMPDKSVFLVFSSYHLRSAASTFGHTLLRFSRHTSWSEHSELLDTGINFAAETDTDNQLLYALKGIFGGFRGQYSLLPYYYKIREYNDYESRDLWSYRLNLSPAAVRRLIDHLWELGHTWATYYYLDENCSFQILAALEAAEPSLNLTAGMPAIILPADTLRAVYEIPGLVSETHYRPGLRSRLRHGLASMSETESSVLWNTVDGRGLLSQEVSGLSQESQAKILETSSNYLAYTYPDEMLKESGPFFQRNNRTLLARSQIRSLSGLTLKKEPEEERPHEAHPPQTLGLAVLPDQNNPGFQLGYRLGHTGTDYPVGQPEGATISFLDLKLSFRPVGDSVSLSDLKVLDVEYLMPWQYRNYSPSYRFSIGLGNFPWISDARAGGVSAGLGLSLPLLPGFLLFTFLDASVLYSKNRGRFLAGPSLGFLYRWKTRLSARLTSELKKPDTGWKAVHSSEVRLHHSRFISSGLHIIKNPEGFTWSLGVQRFF